MLFTALNLTPKGKQLLELKGQFEDIKIGRCLINTTTILNDLSAPATVATKACAGTDVKNTASAHFGGYNQVGNSLQMNIRCHAPQDLSNLDGQLRIVVMANEDIAASTDAETGMPIYKVFEKQDGTVLGYADMIESGNTWTSKSATGFNFSAVITVRGDKPSRCNFKEVLAFAPVSGAGITNEDICQHDVAFPSLSSHEVGETPATAPTPEPRTEP